MNPRMDKNAMVSEFQTSTAKNRQDIDEIKSNIDKINHDLRRANLYTAMVESDYKAMCSQIDDDYTIRCRDIEEDIIQRTGEFKKVVKTLEVLALIEAFAIGVMLSILMFKL